LNPQKIYILPLGKARTVLTATEADSIAIITYGMGVYWSQTAAKEFPGKVELIDLRTIVPLDEETVFAAVRKCSRCLVVTEEPAGNTFAQSLAGRISEICFTSLDAPVQTLGAISAPAIPLNSVLEEEMLPNAYKVAEKISSLLKW